MMNLESYQADDEEIRFDEQRARYERRRKVVIETNNNGNYSKLALFNKSASGWSVVRIMAGLHVQFVCYEILR